MIGANCAVDEEDRRSPQPSAAAAFESSSMETPAETDEENVASSSENASMKAGASGSDEKGFKDSMFNPPTPLSTTSSDGDEGASLRTDRERHPSSGVGSPRAPKRSASSLDGPMVQHAPAPRVLTGPVTTEFATPTHQVRKQSRPNSPSAAGVRAIPPRGRIASIRRESDCSLESEVAHEKLVKTAQQVSLGFEDFCLDDKVAEERKRAKSLTEPISIFTNAFLPQSSSPSPTRIVDTQKQCYSPSTQQVVRSNIPYSPSPSPTPSSPTRHRIMRSMSPIAVRQISKRRYTGSNGSGLDSDGEGASTSNPVATGVAAKRQCLTPRSAASPLVRDAFVQNYFHPESSPGSYPRCSSPLSVSSSTSSLTNFSMQRPRFLLDPSLVAQSFGIQCPGLDSDENAMADDDRCSISVNDNSSTTFSSRAGTPVDEPSNEDPDTVPGLNLNASSCSSSSSFPNVESLSNVESNSPATGSQGSPKVAASPAASVHSASVPSPLIGPVLPPKFDLVDENMEADESAS